MNSTRPTTTADSTSDYWTADGWLVIYPVHAACVSGPFSALQSTAELPANQFAVGADQTPCVIPIFSSTSFIYFVSSRRSSYLRFSSWCGIRGRLPETLHPPANDFRADSMGKDAAN